MARLILLNGPPGIGKSTIARAYADAAPGTVVCDVDELRAASGLTHERARSTALELIAEHLGAEADVVVPQLVVSHPQLLRFERVARDARVPFVEVLLTTDRPSVVRRWRDSGTGEVTADQLLAYHDALSSLRRRRQDTIVVDSVEDDVDATLRLLRKALGAHTGGRSR